MSKELAPVHTQAVQTGQMTREQVDLLKTTICKDATDDEFSLFLQVCKSKGLDPFTRQIHAVKRWNPSTQKKEMAIQIGIDGFRLQAERSGKYLGQDGPYWCGEDGVWSDVWLKSTPPVACKVGIHREGFAAPLYRVCMYSEFVQTKDGGMPNAMWHKMPSNQLAKCTEAVALRAAFPHELSGQYAPEELPDEPPPAPQIKATIIEAAPRPWKTFKEMLSLFSELKEKSPEDLYYKVLKSHGVEHANEFKDAGAAVNCYRELSAIVARLVEPPVEVVAE